MASLLRCLISITVLSHSFEAYKVLVVFPFPDKSHGILGSGIVRHLLSYGHKVTYITPFIEQYPHPNLRQVDVSVNLEMVPNDSMSLTSLMDNKVNLQNHRFILSFGNMVAAKTLENQNVQQLLNDPNETFDLVILDWLLSELLTGIAAVYNTPFIWVSSVEPHWIITRLIDESLDPTYNTDLLSNNISPLNFLQRLEELWTQTKVLFHMYTYNDAVERNEYERLIVPIITKQGRKPPVFDELRFNGSLVLGNSHVSLGQAIRLPQNYKDVGGFHIDEVVKPLPRSLEKIMDGAKNGVIYFSMGSNINSNDLPEEFEKNLFKMFADLKQTVIWKYEGKSAELPKNVHVLEWAPQQSILAHTNCVLFISHGGLLSIIETVHFGIPIIGIPVFGDQFINVERAVNKGFAKRVDLSNSLVKDLKFAIEDILGNSSYAKKAKELSFVYHHRPARIGEELVHWVEHVIQTGGAPHLKSLAIHMPWYQKTYIDLVALITVLLTLTIVVLKRVISVFFFKRNLNSVKKNN